MRRCSSILVATVHAALAAAQCIPNPVLDGAIAGVATASSLPAEVMASVTWDPDGAGPQPARFVLGGNFAIAGGAFASAVVAVDPNLGTCQPLGPGLPGWVLDLVVMPNGELWAGGEFQGSGSGSPVRRWTGSVWTEVGAGQLQGRVEDMVVRPNGDLVVVGNCALAAFPFHWNVARWDGSAWLPLGGGFQAAMNSIVVLPNGDLIAGGNDGTVAYCARWTGTTWAALGYLGGPVRRLAVAPGGQLFAISNSPLALQQWNGASWSVVSTAPWSTSPYCLAVRPNGDLLLGGQMSAGGVSAAVLQRSGGTWTALGGPQTSDGTALPVTHLAVHPNGDVIAGGRFHSIHGVGAAGVAQWTGGAWRSLTPGTSGQIVAMGELANGDVIAAGNFHQLGGVVAHQLARFDGQRWAQYGAGSNGLLLSLLVRSNGDVVVAGYFTSIGGVPASGLASWNGTSWSSLANGVAGNGHALAESPQLGLLAAIQNGAGNSAVSRWTGTAWTALGTGLSGQVRALLPLVNGDVLAGGDMTVHGQHHDVARWDGATWTALAGLPFDVWVAQLRQLADGSVVAATESNTNANAVWRWDGGTWSPLGNLLGRARNLDVLPNGDLLLSGILAIGPQWVGSAMRWDGSVWSPFGPDGGEFRLRARNGDLWFRMATPFAYGKVAGGHVRLEPGCRATVASLASGCGSGAGAVDLVAAGLPWIGSTLRATATGIASGALVVGVHGLGTATTSLASLFPQAVPGCSLHTSADLLAVHAAATGTVVTALAIPNTVAIVGIVVRHQVLAAHLDASQNLTSLRSSDALELVLGAL